MVSLLTCKRLEEPHRKNYIEMASLSGTHLSSFLLLGISLGTVVSHCTVSAPKKGRTAE